jgi:spore coat polysaccharide biosynthesis protein SpsF
MQSEQDFIAVVQARMSSQRLPGKVMKPISGDQLVIDWVLQRVGRASQPKLIVLATTTDRIDDVLVDYVSQKYSHVFVFRGSREDVFSRFASISEAFGPSFLIRVTADCPLVCPELIDSMVPFVRQRSPSYAANCNHERILKGFDLEFIASAALKTARHHPLNDFELEHVTPFFYSSHHTDLSILNFPYPEFRTFQDINFSIDSQLDLDFIRRLDQELHLFGKSFSSIVRLMPEITTLWREMQMPLPSGLRVDD